MSGEGRLANVSAGLLLGGASSRMGRDKAHLELSGVAAATHLARLLAELFEDVMLVGGNPPRDAPGRRVADGAGPRCALRGFVAALSAARAERVVVVAADLMALTPDVVLALVACPEAEAVVPRPDGRAQPLCALYRRSAVLPVARGRLEQGKLALMGVLDGVAVRWLEGADLAALDPDGRALANVNTPQDYQRLVGTA